MKNSSRKEINHDVRSLMKHFGLDIYKKDIKESISDILFLACSDNYYHGEALAKSMKEYKKEHPNEFRSYIDLLKKSM